MFDRGLPDIYTLLYPEKEGESRVFGRALTEHMHCIEPIGSRGVDLVIDRGLTKNMHCYVQRVGKLRVLEWCQTTCLQVVLYSVRVEESRVFDRCLT